MVHKYPGYRNGQRQGARELVTLIYLAFRLLRTNEEIGEELGLTRKAVIARIGWLRDLGDRLFTAPRG